MVPYRGDTLRTEVVRCRTEVIRYVRRRCMVECGGDTLRTELLWCCTEVIRYLQRWCMVEYGGGTRQTAAIPPDTTNSPNNQTF